MNYGSRTLKEGSTYVSKDFMESKEFIKLYRDAGLKYNSKCFADIHKRYPTLCFKRKVGNNIRRTYDRAEAIRYVSLKANTNEDYKSLDGYIKETQPIGVNIDNWRMKIRNKVISKLRLKLYMFYNRLYLTTKDYNFMKESLEDYVNQQQ